MKIDDIHRAEKLARQRDDLHSWQSYIPAGRERYTVGGGASVGDANVRIDRGRNAIIIDGSFADEDMLVAVRDAVSDEIDRRVKQIDDELRQLGVDV